MGTSTSALLDQVLPGAQFLGRWRNQDARGNGYLSLGISGGGPDHLFWSYSTVRILTSNGGSCSGSFIGPNVLLTAGHCGHFGFSDTAPPAMAPPPMPFNALLYSEGSDDADQAVLTSQCQTLLQNIGSGDTHLVYCDDVRWFNGTIPPGEMFGMADFDLDPLKINEPVWTSWWNPSCPGWDRDRNYDKDACPGRAQMIFSPGRTTKIEPLGVYGADGLVTDQLMAQGASGGGIWRQTAGSSHRLVSSGITNGPCYVGEAACAGFKAATIRSALKVATPASVNGINEARLRTLGLIGGGSPWTRSDYEGLMDSDQNGFFDVQERLDELNGIRSGDSIWLGFESRRMNHMWWTTPKANVVFYDKDRFARVDYADQGDEIILEMPKVFLSPGRTYRVSLMTYTDASSAPNGLAVELWAAGASSPASTLPIPTPATSKWTMFSGELQSAGVPIHAVKIRVKGIDYHGNVAALPLIRQGSANRFDTQTDRQNWRNDTTGARAWILPYGDSNRGSEIDWAGLVNDETNEIIDWSLRNRQLAIDPTQTYRVCFDVRSYPQNSGTGTGLIVLGSGAAEAGPSDGPEDGQHYVDESFTFTDTWTTVCSETAFQADAGDNLLKFGHIKGEPEYLVDDVQIQQQ